MPWSSIDNYAWQRASYGGDVEPVPGEYTIPADADQVRLLRAIGVDPEPVPPAEDWDVERVPASEFPDDLDAILADRAEM